ncbi:MAG: FAD-dependent oxidoreductase [Pseudomonadota bacterium]
MGFDVTIVGAGVIGAAAAFHLADRGFKVALVSDGARGGSMAAAGMLSPSFEIGHDAADPTFAAMLRAGLAAWEDFAYRLADDPYTAFGYHRRGVYGIGYHAVPQGAVVPETGQALNGFTTLPSAFAPEEGAVEPAPFIETALGVLQRQGGTLIKGRARLEAGAVIVNGERISSAHVIIATGASSGLGPESLQAVRGEAFVVELDPQDAGCVPTVVRSPTVYFVPRRDGSLYVGATEEWPGAIAGTADEVWRDAVRLLPALSRVRSKVRVSGARPFLSRGGPLIHRDDEGSGVIRAQGHHRNGVLLAALTAQRLEDILRDS